MPKRNCAKLKSYDIVDTLTKSLKIKLFPPQKEILTQAFLDNDFNFIISTPPGTGKSLLAFLAMAQAYSRGLKSIYLSPLKAIISEKKCEFSKYLSILFPEAKIGVFTGEQNEGKKRDYDFLLMTYEKLDSSIRRLSSNLDWFSNVGCVAIDEFHQIDENIRGVRLEGLLTRLGRSNPFLRLVCFSATIPNIYEVSKFLNAVPYTSSWMRISVDKKIRLFENVSEKEKMLLEEIRTTIKDGGKVLVFVNSRRRSEEICELIKKEGIECLHHHAGLSSEKRMHVEEEFRNGKTQVLVSTSTLEMGVNLPARKVINYDSSIFTYDGFIPLSVRSFVQRSGRAGRPGLDDFGESVLLLPSWSKLKDAYMNLEIEEVRSSLNFKKNLSEQVIVELTSGLSRTKEDLEFGFVKRTLFSLQNGNEDGIKHLGECIPDLLSAELVKEKNGYISTTRLGRVLSYLYLSPNSIKIVRSLLENIKPNRFDYLLCISLLSECEPKIWLNSEDLDIIGKAISNIQSKILDMRISDILFYTNLNKQMVLSAVKSALILNAMIDTFPEKLLADKFGIYEIDILLLRKNAKKLLDNASVIFNILEKKEHAKECKLVSYMLQSGFSEDAAIMCKIQGLGAKRCKKLISNGIKNVYDLSQTKEEEISKICRIETNSAKQIISDARKIAKEWMNTKSHDNALSIFNKISEKGTMSPACPHRLKRSLALSVKACGEYKWIVSGGREEHKVIRFVGLECDCKDFMSRRKDCKHILAVKREIGILPIVKDENDISLRDAFSYTKYHEYSGEENG